MSPKGKPKVIVSAGTVTVRELDGKTPQVLLVHRPAYDDWSLPKGHLEPHEFEPVAAARETWEETGVHVTLGRPVGTISYPVTAGTKVVHYWRATPREARRRKPDREVDKVAWLTPRAALARMSYADERSVVAQALELEPTTAFLIVRHAKAMLRKNWSGRDRARPITARGRGQSKDLIALLDAYGVRNLASSTSTRCMQTLMPYARRHDLDIHGWAQLSEEVGEEDLDGVEVLMTRLAIAAATGGAPTAVCGHRPVLPTMIEAVGVVPRPMQTAATIVTHLDEAGTSLAWEFHRPRR